MTDETRRAAIAAELEPRSHAGVLQLLGLHFVQTGRLDAEDSRTFARLQKYRVEADYSVGFTVTPEGLQEDSGRLP